MPARHLDAVLLDLGNVLVFHDNPALIHRIAARTGGGGDGERRLAESLGGGLGERINRGDLTGEQIRREVCQLAGGDVPMEEFALLWSSHFALNEKIFPIVEVLAREVPLVLVSNTNELHWNYLRPRLEVLKHFIGLVLSFEVRAAKPDAAIFRRALDITRTPPDRTAFFDDFPSYVDGARKLGILAHLFTDNASFERQLVSLGLRPR